MIISDEHRYVFIEVPHTASTAVSAELREHYGGRAILHKHANYSEFFRWASAEQRRYFSFAAVRNPLDAVVTDFYKFAHNHRGNYTAPEKARESGGWVSREHRERYEFVKQNKADFAAYFRRFASSTYNNWYLMGHRHMDFVMRFERIAEDFERALRAIGLEPIRPLPLVNQSNRPRQLEELYTPELREIAVRHFGPFMERWGYRFPNESWNEDDVPRMARAKFRVLDGFVGVLGRHVTLSPRSPRIERLRQVVRRFV